MIFNIYNFNRDKTSSFSSSNSTDDNISITERRSNSIDNNISITERRSNSIDDNISIMERRSNSIDDNISIMERRSNSIDYADTDYELHIKNKWIKRQLSGKMGICQDMTTRIRDSYTITNNNIEIPYTPPRCNFMEYMQLLDTSYNYFRK